MTPAPVSAAPTPPQFPLPEAPVMVICPHAESSQKISFERPLAGLRPVHYVLGQAHLASEMPGIMARIQPAMVVLSRYHNPNGSQWVQAAHARGVPCVFHLDDDLLAVPASIGAKKYQAYSSPDRIAALKRNMAACDLIYASTPVLGQRLRAADLPPPVFSARQYYSLDPDRIARSLPPATGPVIGYMGAGSHAEDLALIVPVIETALARLPALQFDLFGPLEMPAQLARFGHRVRQLPPEPDYDRFLTRLQELGWWVGLAPLVRNGFNDCKADTKWAEYTQAGMAVLASDSPAYRTACAGGCGLLAADATQWQDSLGSLLGNAALRQSIRLNAQEKLRQDYGHDGLLQQISQIYLEAKQHMETQQETA